MENTIRVTGNEEFVKEFEAPDRYNVLSDSGAEESNRDKYNGSWRRYIRVEDKS